MKIKNLLISFFLLSIFVECGSFQTSSYSLSDGIYYETPNLIQNNKSDKTKYYSNYFQNIGDNYSLFNSNDEYFIDSENYFSSNSNNQLAWGDNVSQTEVIFTNYGFPRYWSFYNQGYYNPFFFNRLGYYNRYNRLAFGWGYHNPYYSPFYSPYYSPFYNSFYSPFYNPFYSSRPYYNRQNYYADIDYKKRKYSNFSKSNSRRGEKNYPNSKTGDKEISSSTNNKSDSELDIRTALNRLNVGRGRYLDSRISSNFLNPINNKLGSKSRGSLTKRPQISGRFINSSKGSTINNKSGRGFSSSSVRNYSRETNRSSEVNTNRQSNRQYYYKENNSSNRNNFQINNNYNNNQRNSSYGRSNSPSRSYSSGRTSNNSSNSRSSSGGSSRGSRPH